MSRPASARSRSSSRATGTTFCGPSSTSAGTAAPSWPRERPARETLQCPCHGWTYGLDGDLKAAPRSNREAGFDCQGISLRPASVGAWRPFLFANPDPEAAPLADVLGDLPELVAAAGVDVHGLRHHARAESTVEANWKLAAENFLECYGRTR